MDQLPIYIQLFRNLFCVIKALYPNNAVINLKLLNTDWFIFKSETTLIEWGIAPLQFCAVIFNVSSSIKLVSKGINNVNTFSRGIKYLDRLSVVKPSRYILVVRQRLHKEIRSTYHSIFSGILQSVIAVCFYFLTCNSLHIYGPTHPKPLYAALIAQEICLVYFLVMMVYGMLNISRVNSDCTHLAEVLEVVADDTTNDQLLSVIYDSGFGQQNRLHDAFLYLDTSYVPWDALLFQAGSVTQFSPMAFDNVLNRFEPILSPLAKNEQNKLSRANLVAMLYLKGEDNNQKLFLEFIYFVLNVIAGYGYFMAIMVWCVPFTAETVPSWLNLLYFGLSPESADWWGNFLGDLAWTIEPIVMIMISYLESIAHKTAAVLSREKGVLDFVETSETTSKVDLSKDAANAVPSSEKNIPVRSKMPKSKISKLKQT